LGEIYFTHAARAEVFDNLVMAEPLAAFMPFAFDFNDVGDNGNGGLRQKVLGFIVRGEQRFDFSK
jgi:hypothetical protein